MCTCLLFQWGKVWSQNPDDKFNVTHLNIRYLEHLVKEGVDSVRLANGLPALANDVILHKAAWSHARYLDSTKRLTHFQNERGREAYKTPQNRAEKFGAGKEYLVGENVAKVFVGKPQKDKKGRIYINDTYRKTANDLVLAWVNSPPHYENILQPSFQVTGLAIVINLERKEVKAVQKFAHLKYVYTFHEDSAYFSYSNWKAPDPITSFQGISQQRVARKFQWKIRSPKDSIKQCGACNLAIDTAWYRDELEPQGRRIVFTTPNIPMAVSMVKPFGSKLAIEVVKYGPFDCGNPEYYTLPSRRNNQSLLNGEVIKPVKRSKLKRSFRGLSWKEARKADSLTGGRFQVSLGSVPRSMDDYVAYNLLVIKGKKLCRVMHLTRYPGKPIQLLFDVPYLTKIQRYDLDLSEKKRTIAFRIPFDLGKSTYSVHDIKPLIDSLYYDGFVVERSAISAFSSVEGDESVNKSLQIKRAESVAAALRSTQKTEFPYTIQARENWPMFREQIAAQPGLDSLKMLSNEEIRKIVNGASLDFEPFLKEQRYADVTLHVRIRINDNNLGSYLKGEFYRCRDSVNFEIERSGGLSGRGQQYQDTMAVIQGFAYQKILEGKVDSLLLDQLELPLNPDFARVIKDHFWYSLSLGDVKKGDALWEQRFFQRLNELERRGISSYEIRFDIANYLVRNAGVGRSRVKLDEKSLALIESLLDHEQEERRELAKRLWVNFHIKKGWLLAQEKRPDEEALRNSMQALFDHFSQHGAHDSLLTRVSEAMSYARQEDLAYSLIRDRALMEHPFPDLLVLFNKLSYQHIEESQDEGYFLWLMDSYRKLENQKWCDMFVGPNNINFQVFDHEELRRFYCEKCGAYRNYAEDPENWPTD